MAEEETRERLEALEDRIETLEAENQALMEMAESDDGTTDATRRQALGLLGGAGLGGGLAAASRPAAAQSTSGQWENTDGDGLLELPNHAGIDGVNNVNTVEPGGSIQAAIDEAAGANDGHAVVRLFPGTRYNEGAEIHLRPGVTLDFNGGFLVLNSDHNGIFVDNGAQIRNATIKVITDGSYTSSAIILDTSRSEYGLYTVTKWRSGVYVDATIEGKRKDGHGLELNDTAGKGIGLGVRFNLNIVAFDTAIYANTGSGYINGIEAYLTINNPRIGLDIEGNGEFNSTLTGAMQPMDNSETGIRNRTGKVGPTWRGQLWDSWEFTNNALVGERITVIGTTCRSIKGNTDGSHQQMGISFKNSRINMYDYESDTRWILDNNSASNDFRIGAIDGSGDTERYLRIKQNGKITPANDGWLQIYPEDLRYRKPRGAGEIAVAANRATDTDGPELAIAGNGGNWNLWYGDKIYPE